MRAQVRNIIEALYASWAAKDLDAVLDCFSEDAVFDLHLPADIAPFAGESRGKEILAQRLLQITEAFDFISYRPVLITQRDHAFHAQVHYRFRHKESGHELEGSMRHVGQMTGDKVSRLDEFHDEARVRAFFELVAMSADGAGERTFPNIKRNR
jgi:ketosteroid isomerase-like protein